MAVPEWRDGRDGRRRDWVGQRGGSHSGPFSCRACPGEDVSEPACCCGALRVGSSCGWRNACRRGRWRRGRRARSGGDRGRGNCRLQGRPRAAVCAVAGAQASDAICEARRADRLWRGLSGGSRRQCGPLGGPLGVPRAGSSAHRQGIAAVGRGGLTAAGGAAGAVCICARPHRPCRRSLARQSLHAPQFRQRYARVLLHARLGAQCHVLHRSRQCCNGRRLARATISMRTAQPAASGVGICPASVAYTHLQRVVPLHLVVVARPTPVRPRGRRWLCRPRVRSLAHPGAPVTPSGAAALRHCLCTSPSPPRSHRLQRQPGKRVP